MRKRVIALLVATITVLAGCGEKKVVEEYPNMDSAQVKEQAESVTEAPEQPAVKGDKVEYEITNNKGNVVYRINAQKQGDESESYTVVQIGYQKFDDAIIEEMANNIFDEGSIRVIMPYLVAEADYLNDRQMELESRKAQYSGSGVEVPRYIEQELDNIEKVFGMPNTKNYEKIACPDTPQYIDLVDYYSKKGIVQDEIGFCYMEGTIDGEYYRMDCMSLMNNRTIHIYREQSNVDQGEYYTLLESEEYLPENDDAITQKEAESQFNEIMRKVTGDESDMMKVTTYPVRLFGAIENQGLLYQNSGYQCFYSSYVDGHFFPVTSLTDFCSLSFQGTHIPVNPQNIVDIVGHENIFDALTLEKSKGSRTYYNGYQSIGACFDEKGLVDLYITNPMGSAGQNFKYIQNTPMISFEEADERARAYLRYAIDNNLHINDSDSSVTEIKTIELAMCRLVSNDDYYIIPAWYYLAKSNNADVLDRPIVVVNAIDGTIIDVQKGGVIVDF